MKRHSLRCFTLLLVAIMAVPAFAGQVNFIALGGSGGGTPVTFTGLNGGNSFSVNFNVKNLLAAGFGTMASNGFYTIQNSGAMVTSNGSCGTGCWLLSQTQGLLFKYGSTAGASNLLLGSLQLLDITQSAPTRGGIFNDNLMVNLIINPSSSLASAFANNKGIVTLQIHFKSTTDLATLLSGQTLAAGIVGGTVSAPEPASLIMLGTGLLALAGLVRRAKFSKRSLPEQVD
jgi:hypothetical protein